jgi:nickel-dependent lactate racemase
MGRSSVGNDILVNRLVVEADFVIGIGNIVPHPAAGFAGGGKIVDPGCVSDETCGAFHWESVKYPAQEVVGRRDNPMIAMIDEVARKAGLSYIVNTVMDGRNQIVRVVTGDPVEAHRCGCETAREVYGVRIPRRADIVICDSHPADLEMWQGIKGLCTADLCVKPGGVVIMATPCPEGASEEHPELERYGYLNFADTEALVNEGKVSMVVGHHMVQGGRLIDRVKRVYLVSNHLSPEQIARLRFQSAATVQDAYAQAVSLLGPEASVTFLRNAAELFPVIED